MPQVNRRDERAGTCCSSSCLFVELDLVLSYSRQVVHFKQGLENLRNLMGAKLSHLDV